MHLPLFEVIVPAFEPVVFSEKCQIVAEILEPILELRRSFESSLMKGYKRHHGFPVHDPL
jgi:hypothetical protein